MLNVKLGTTSFLLENYSFNNNLLKEKELAKCMLNGHPYQLLTFNIFQ